MAIGLAIAVLVLVAIAYAVIRYRRREGREVREPRGLKALEAIWVAVVAAIVVVLLVTTFRTEDRVDAVPANPSLTIRVAAFQWGWRFTYPGGVSVTGNDQRPPMLVVPADETIRFELTSRDVIHAFWIPEQRFKRDAFPKRTTEFDQVFDRGVSTTARCAEFCGLGHDRMNFEVVSMPPGQFDAWLQRRQAAAEAAS